MWCFTAGCLIGQGRWNHLKTTWALIDVWYASATSHSKRILKAFSNNTYLNCLLLSCVLMKNVSCCCVHENCLLSNPVTFDNYKTIRIYVSIKNVLELAPSQQQRIKIEEIKRFLLFSFKWVLWEKPCYAPMYSHKHTCNYIHAWDWSLLYMYCQVNCKTHQYDMFNCFMRDTYTLIHTRCIKIWIWERK